MADHIHELWDTLHMRQYSIFHIPVWSFFSRPLYAEIGTRWRGTCLGYLFLLLLFCWAITIYRLHIEVCRYIDSEVPAIAAQVPTVTITNGLAHVTVEQPYVISDPDTDRPILIIDTTGATSSLMGSEAMALLTADELIMRRSETETRAFKVSELEGTSIDSKTVNAWAQTVKRYFALAIYPFSVLVSFLARAMEALIFAGLGMLLSRRLGAGLRFAAALRLAITALSPAIMVKTIATALGVFSGGASILAMIMTLAFLVFGIRATMAPPPDATFAPRQ